ncbi:MAG: hypothetical protein E1N59_393 [Puniceicoccaceae bacterium 5H]|nr:MAG: hypothetical protein E1N59_393 [Puniceicoccaceae bacterium 5H]
MDAERNQVVGVDGCRFGWIAVAGKVEPETMRLYRTFSELWQEWQDAVAIAVDMPIGLPTGRHSRACDQAARSILQVRAGAGSRVFPCPIREVLACATYPAALELHRRVGGRGLSKQAFYLLPKIRQIDALLQTTPASREPLFECHPELAAARLNGGVPLGTKKRQADLRRRLKLLCDWYPSIIDFYEQWRLDLGSRAKPDDLVDALLCWLTARRPLARRGRLPVGDLPLDVTGLPMQIVF